MCNIKSLEAVQRPQWVFSIWGFHMWYIIFFIVCCVVAVDEGGCQMHFNRNFNRESQAKNVHGTKNVQYVESSCWGMMIQRTVRFFSPLTFSPLTFFLFLTFNFEVVSPETVRLKVEGQRGVGLVQEQVHPGQLNALPLKHRTQDLSGAHRGDDRAVVVHPHQNTKRHHVWQWEGNTWIPADSTDLRVFFFIAGTISVSMSTFRSNLRLKHSLLGSWRHNRTLSLHVDEGFSPYPPDPP